MGSPVACRHASLGDRRHWYGRGALLAYRQDFDAVPDSSVDGGGERFEVFDVASGVLRFHPVEAIEDLRVISGARAARRSAQRARPSAAPRGRPDDEVELAMAAC